MITVPVPPEIKSRSKQICANAGIPESFLSRSMKEVCSAQEYEWVKNFRKPSDHEGGLCLVGKSADPNQSSRIDDRMMLMAAAFTRNFITARVVTAFRLVDYLKERDENFDKCTVLLIPNLFVQTHGKTFTGWQIAGIHDLLLTRLTQGLKTVLYVESTDEMSKQYGSSVADLINEHYQILEIRKCQPVSE
jgi:hypothetical protein